MDLDLSGQSVQFRRSHSIVMGVHDRIVVLNFGEILGAGTLAKIRAHHEVVAFYLGVTGPGESGK